MSRCHENAYFWPLRFKSRLFKMKPFFYPAYDSVLLSKCNLLVVLPAPAFMVTLSIHMMNVQNCEAIITVSVTSHYKPLSDLRVV